MAPSAPFTALGTHDWSDSADFASVISREEKINHPPYAHQLSVHSKNNDALALSPHGHQSPFQGIKAFRDGTAQPDNAASGEAASHASLGPEGTHSIFSGGWAPLHGPGHRSPFQSDVGAPHTMHFSLAHHLHAQQQQQQQQLEQHCRQGATGKPSAGAAEQESHLDNSMIMDVEEGYVDGSSSSGPHAEMLDSFVNHDHNEEDSQADTNVRVAANGRDGGRPNGLGAVAESMDTRDEEMDELRSSPPPTV